MPILLKEYIHLVSVGEIGIYKDYGSYQLYVYYDGSYVETVRFSVEFGIISDVYTVSRTDGIIYISSPVQVSTFLNNITGNILENKLYSGE